MKWLLIPTFLLYCHVILAGKLKIKSDGDLVKIEVIEDSIGMACSKGNGEGQKLIKKLCSEKGGVNWGRTNLGKCNFKSIGKKNGKEEFQGNWKMKFVCKD